MDIDHLYKCFLETEGINTDSRKTEPGQMFFALSGENFNGNKFALSALEKGASYVVVEEEVESDSDKLIKVDNALEALQKLANHHRRQLDTTIIAITGSNGKTTTKELMHQVLASQYNCHFTKGNLNNHIGVPLTLLELDAKHELAIVEMGANHIKEIKALCLIAEPNIGMITNIGKAHIEGFGSLEGVIKAKSEMYDFLKSTDGIIFYNGEDALLEKQVDGYSESNKYYPSEISPIKIDASVLSFKWGEEEIVTNLTGHYNLFNIAAAISVGSYFKVSNEKMLTAISEYIPSNNRSQLLTKDGVEYILDAYNANPTSMRLSLENFFSINADKKILILGDMLELGDISFDEHSEMISYLATCTFEKAFLVGNEFSKHPDSRDERIQFFKETSALKKYLMEFPISKDSKVLLKGSRGLSLEKLLH